MKHNLQNKSTRFLSVVCMMLLLFATTSSYAQLTGSITVPSTNYPTIKVMVDSLNLYGPGPGGVTFNIAAGTTETAPLPAGYKLTATGTLANPIVIRKDPATVGANPLITSFVGTTTLNDGVFFLLGSDYVTIDGIDIIESGTNSTATTQMEWGYALLNKNATAPFDGCNNNTIKNCSITLNKLNANSRGIYLNHHISTGITALTITAVGDASSNNKFYANKIQNTWVGIQLTGFDDPTFTFRDMNNDVGGSSYATSDTITNLGAGAASTTGGAIGVYLTNQMNPNVSYNYINNALGGAPATLAATGVYATGSVGAYQNLNNHVSITHNALYLTQSAPGGVSNCAYVQNYDGNITFTYNDIKLEAVGIGTGTQYGFFGSHTGSSAGTATLTFKYNTAKDFTISNSTGLVAIFNTGALNQSIQDVGFNTINNIIRSNGTTGNFYGFYSGTTTSYGFAAAGSTSNYYNNVITNITLSNSGAGVFYAIQSLGNLTCNYYNNVIGNITCSNVTGQVTMMGIYQNGGGDIKIYDNTISDLNGAKDIQGIYTDKSSRTLAIYNNQLFNLTSTGNGFNAYGITLFTQGSISSRIYNNKIYAITQTSTGLNTAQGINIVNGATGVSTLNVPVYVYNNIIGNIKAPLSTVTATPSVMGINVGSVNTLPFNAYISYNNVYLNDTAGANTHSAAIFHNLTASRLYLNNNLLVNNTYHAAGTGIACGIMRSGASLATYDVSSNNNLIYAGANSSRNLIHFDGVNKDSIWSAFKTRVSPREAGSFTHNIVMFNAASTPAVTAASANYLQNDTTVGSLTESGAVNIAGITTDIRGKIRQGNPGYVGTGSKPDIGAFESQGPGINMVYDSVLVVKDNSNALVNSTNQQVVNIQVNVSGSASAVSATQFTLTTTGTTAVANIVRAKLFYCGSSTSFATTTPFGTAVVSPSGTFTFTGSQPMVNGTNHFWLVYDIASTTIGNIVDANVTSVIVGGVTKTPLYGNPTATKTIAAPLAGSYTIGTGVYTTLNSIVTALNANGISADVTVNVPAGFIETAPAGGYMLGSSILNSTLSASKKLIFQRSGVGANPLLTAAVGTSATLDGIFTMQGTDYVTIDGIDLRDTSTISATTQMEWGYGLLKLRSAAPFDGCQNNTIKNSTVTLNRLNTNSKGIYVNNHVVSDATNLIITAVSDANSYNRFVSDSVQNVNTGIYINGFAASSSVVDFSLYDMNNVIGDSGNTGNVIVNFGGAVAGFGINVLNQTGARIGYNYIDNYNGGINGAVGSTLLCTGILHTYTNTSSANPSDVKVFNNKVYLTMGAAATGGLMNISVMNSHGDVAIDNNSIKWGSIGLAISSSTLTGINYNTQGATLLANKLSVKGNVAKDFSYTKGGTSAEIFFNLSGAAITEDISYDSVYNVTRIPGTTVYSGGTIFLNALSGSSPALASNTSLVRNIHHNVFTGYNNGSTSTGSITGMGLTGTYTINVYNNTISSITNLGTVSASVLGIFCNSNTAVAQFYNIYDNRIDTLICSAGLTWGINFVNNGQGANIYRNSISNLTSGGAAAQYVIGIFIQTSGRNFKCYNNKIWGLTNTTTGLGYTAGILHNGMGLNAMAYTPAKFYNNIIGNLSASTATITATPAVMGIGLAMNTAYAMTDVYHNTISLSGTVSGVANSAGIYLGGTPSLPIFKIGNNIVINKMTSSGVGVVSAIQRPASSSVSAIDNSSNNNILYAGTPSATNVLFNDGTNKDQTMLAYQTRMYPRDNMSASADVSFISSVGTSSYFLYPDSTLATLVSNGGVRIPEIGNDFNNTTRSSTVPDIGAFEGNFTNASDLIAPGIVAQVLSNIAVSQTAVSLTATVKDAFGSSTVVSGNGPRVYYRKSGTATYTSGAGTLASGTLTNGVWNFTINAAAVSGWLVNDTIYYYVVAQDNIPNIASAPAGVVATTVNTITADPVPLKFVIKTGLSGTYTLCATGCDFSSLTNTYGAFDSINKSAITANVTLSINGDLLNETGTVGLNPIAQSGNYGIKIIPNSTTERLIAGNTGATAGVGLITFNGADNVTIDGRFAGDGKYLRIRNRNTNGSTIKFMNDAHLDTVKYVFIEGNTTTVGNVYFAAPAAGGTGNDSNAVMYCEIRDTLGNGIAASLTTMTVQNTAVYSEGLMNSENTIANNNIYNFLYQGINIGSGLLQDNWLITGNSFYQQPAAAAKAPSLGSPYTQAIQMNVGQGHIITNNSIGGSAPDRSGAAWKAAYGTVSGGALSFKGIEIGTNILLDRPITINGNKISNIDANPAGYAYSFAGISMAGGVVNVTNNVIGGGILPYDTIKEGSTTIPTSGGGIVLTGGILTVENNIIGNYSNYLSYLSVTATITNVRTAGINIVGGGSNTPLIFNVNNNTIRDIRSNYTYLPTGVPTNYLNPQGTSPVGILVTATAGAVNMEGNTIYNIINTSTTGLNNQAHAITVRNSSAVCSIKRNRIYGIGASGNGSGLNANGLYGIYVSVNQGSTGSTIQNNQISIAPGIADESNIFGIVDGSINSFTHIANNSIYIGGTAIGNSNSYGVLLGMSASFTVDSVYNNILYNGRTGGTASHYAVGAYYMPTVINPLRFGYNLMVSPSANTIMELPAGTSMNAAAVNAMYISKSSNSNWMETSTNLPAASLFTNTATANLGLNAANAASWYANGKGLPMTSVTNDFANVSRTTTIVGGATDIGSMEVTPSVAPASAIASAAPAVNTTTNYTFGGRTVASVTWGAAGTVPTALDVKYYSGTNAPSLTANGTRYNAYYAVTPTGGTGYTYTMALAYDSAVMGNVGTTVPSRMAYYNASTWTWLSTSSANSATGLLSSGSSLAAATLPANFTGTNVNAPLPVKLIRFAGAAVLGDVQLDWATASEINNAGFEVERSVDGKSFEQIGFVKGAGNSSKLLSYNLTDTKAFATAASNSLYYRLKQVDMDGYATYSEVINVSEEMTETMSMSLYPNPTMDEFNISVVAKASGKMDITIIDIQGKVVANLSKETMEGLNTMTMNSSLLNGSGIYFVKVNISGETKVMKLIKH